MSQLELATVVFPRLLTLYGARPEARKSPWNDASAEPFSESGEGAMIVEE